MGAEKNSPAGCFPLLADFEDDLRRLEEKAAFVAMATSALGMLADPDLEAISSSRAWAWLVHRGNRA